MPCKVVVIERQTSLLQPALRRVSCSVAGVEREIWTDRILGQIFMNLKVYSVRVFVNKLFIRRLPAKSQINIGKLWTVSNAEFK